MSGVSTPGTGAPAGAKRVLQRGEMSRLQEFERVVLPHMEAAFNLAYWLVRSRPDAEDVVQDAVLRAFRAFDSLRSEDARPWLLAIVRNVAYRWLSSRQRAGNVISLDEAVSGRPGADRPRLEIAAEEPSAEARLIAAGERELVLEAIALLAPVQREVIVLRELEELSYREIADIIGAPIGTVMSRLSRARSELKSKLEALIEGRNKNAV